MKLCSCCIYLNMDIKKKIPGIILITIVIISAFFILREWAAEGEEEEKGQGPLLDWVKELMMEPYLPAIRRMHEDKSSTFQGDYFTRGLLLEYPVLLFYLQAEDTQEYVTESDYARLLVLEGSDEDRKSIREGDLEYGEDAMHLEQSVEDELLKENERYLAKQPEEDDNMEERKEPVVFQPAAEKSFRYQWEGLTAYEDLIKAFYAVDSTTRAGDELLQAKELLSKDMRIQGTAENPQILIYHTHSQEAFADSVPGDENSGILGAGEYLASILREQYGYNVMHHTACYDMDRDYAYSNSLPEIEKLLAENPSIEVVIDLHRDAMPPERRLVVDLQGRPTAQFMFFNGLSRSTKGEISYLENPYLEDNLAFSFQMQAACNEYYPGIARRIYLKAYRYNMHLRPKTLLIEMGAQNNTEEEIHNACEPLAHVLHLVLSGQEPER